MLTLKYGAVTSVFSNNRLGAGQNVTYTYKTFCFTLGKLHERLDNYELRKLLLLISLPGIFKQNNFATVLYIAYNISESIGTYTLIDIDINFYRDNVRRPDDYKKFFLYLFTGDVDGAENIVKDVPDEFVNKVLNMCMQGGK